MTDVLDTPSAPTEGEAGPVEGGNGLVDAPLSPFDYAADDEEAAGGPELERTRWWQSESNRSLVQLALSIAVVGGCVVYVLVNIHANLILDVNTPTGGDFGAHVWGAGLPADHILPHWRLSAGPRTGTAGSPCTSSTWWCRPWSRCCSTSSCPYGVASRWSALGLVALPVCCWPSASSPLCPSRSRRCSPSRRPSSSSTGRSRSTAATWRRRWRGVLLQPRPVHVDAVPRRARPGHTDGEGAPLGGALRLTVLCHLIVGIFAAVATLLLFVLWADRKRTRYLVTMLPVAGLLTAFWTLPFLFGGAYMTDMTYERRPVGNAERAAGLVLADALPVRGLDRHPRVRTGGDRPRRLRHPRPAGRGVPRPRGRGLRDLGLHLAAEPPVERSTAAVHVPWPATCWRSSASTRSSRSSSATSGWSCATARPARATRSGGAAGIAGPTAWPHRRRSGASAPAS